MPCFFVIGLVSAIVQLRFDNRIYPMNKFKLLYNHERCSIIYDPSNKQGYMQVAGELEGKVENVYKDIERKNLARVVFRKEDAEKRSGSELEEDEKDNARTLVAEALKYLDASDVRSPSAKITQIMATLNLFKDQKYEVEEGSMPKKTMYNPREDVVIIRVGIKYMENALDDVQPYGYVQKYDIKSKKFSSYIEGFYRNIYDKNGVIIPPKDGEPPYIAFQYFPPVIHAILSVMGATNRLIRVEDSRKQCNYYFKLAPYRDVFGNSDLDSIHERIYTICMSRECIHRN